MSERNDRERALDPQLPAEYPTGSSGSYPEGRADRVLPAASRAIEAMALEDEIGLDEIFRILRRQWWVVAAVFSIVVAATAVYTFVSVPVWEASTLIRVEGERGGPAGGEDFIGGLWRSGELETEMRVAGTQPILARVVDDLGLVLQLRDPAEIPRDHIFAEVVFDRSAPEAKYEISRFGEVSWELRAVEPQGLIQTKVFQAGQPVEVPGGFFVLASDDAIRDAGFVPPQRLQVSSREFEAVLASLQNQIRVARPDREASLFRVSWQGTDRHLVRDVVNAVASSYLAQRQDIRKTEARSTVAFLRNQSAQVRAELEAAEAELREFREAEQVVALEAEAHQQVRHLAELQAERAQIDAERAALENLLHGIRASAPGARPDYRKLVAFPTFLQNRTIENLIQSLTEAEGRRTELRERWRPTHPGIVALDERIEELEAQLGHLGQNYLQSLNDQIASKDSVLARFGMDLERVPGKELRYARLERQTRLLTNLHSFLEQRLKEAEISEAVEDPSVRVVEAALLPRQPVSPRPARNLALATVLGLILGVGLGFVREYLDKAIHADDDVDALLGLPVLSRVPSLPVAGNGGGDRRQALVTHVEARSLPAESYRTLRTNITYSHWQNGGGGREMVITSPGPKDGKSVTASNLAVTFAQQGRKTLLVDADLRKSVQHNIFQVDRRPGLSDLLIGRIPLEEVVKATKLQNLYVIPAGITPPNPSELLGSPLMDYFLQRAREDYEAVIFDAPPALAVTDAAVLAGKMDGVLLVVRSERTHQQAAKDVVEQFRRVGAHLMGVVVNDVKQNGRYGYRYRYYYDYYGDDQERPRPNLGRT